MIKKGLIAAGTLVTAFMMSLGITLAQSPSPTSSPTPTASPSATSIPAGAPATGHGG